MKLSIASFLMVVATVCHAGPLDGTTWSDGKTTVTFYTEGGKTMGRSHRMNGIDWSFETRPFRGNGVQWYEFGGGAISVFEAELQGDKLAIFVQSGTALVINQHTSSCSRGSRTSRDLIWKPGDQEKIGSEYQG